MSKPIVIAVLGLGVMLLAIVLTGCSGELSPAATALSDPTSTATATPTNTPTSDASPTATNTPTPEPTLAPTTAPTPTATPSPIATAAPTPEPTLESVDPVLDEYLTQVCVSDSQDLDEYATYGDISALYGEEIARRDALIPPVELTAFHQSALELIRAIKEISDQQPQDAEADFEVLFAPLLESLEEYEARQMDILSRISTATLRRMADAGCIDPEEVPDDHANKIDGNATPLTVGIGIQGEIDYEGDSDYFSFTATEGQLYRIEVTLGTLSAADVVLRRPVEGGATGEGGNRDPQNPIFVWKAPGSDEYYIELTADERSEIGDYTLTIRLAVDDHGDVVDSATIISQGVAAEGILEVWDDVDVFKFTGEAGRLYKLDMISSTQFFYAEVYISDSECWDGLCGVAGFNSNDAAGYQDGPESGNSWHTEEPSDYYVLIQRFETGASYTLTITDVTDDHANTPGGATAATVGVPTEGVMDWEYDLDYFRFTAEEGRTYSIKVELGTLPESRIRLLNQDGEELAEDTREEGILWKAHQSGNYYVEVKGGFLGWETGSYTLSITAVEDDRGAVLQDDQDHGDFQEEATAISVGETLEGTISDRHDADWFVFNAEAGKEYRVFTRLDTLEFSWLLLYSSDDQLVAQTNNESWLTWQAPDSGAYYIEIQGVSETGTYTLTVGEDDYGDTPTDAATIAVGQPVEGALGYESDGDVFAFEAEAGQTYQFVLVPGTLQVHNLSLWTSDTGWMRLDQPTWEAPRSGEAYLAVWSSVDDTGTYTLTITRVGS